MPTYRWPFSNITPIDVGRFASQGDWDAVRKVAKVATRNRTAGIDAITVYNPDEKVLRQIRGWESEWRFQTWEEERQGKPSIVMLVKNLRRYGDPQRIWEMVSWLEQNNYEYSL